MARLCTVRHGDGGGQGAVVGPSARAAGRPVMLAPGRHRSFIKGVALRQSGVVIRES